MEQQPYKRHAFSWLTDADYATLFSLSPMFFINNLINQFRTLPLPTKDFTAHTVIITGSNIGLGLEAARHFTRLGAAKVILGCRNLDKAEAAKTDIESSTDTKGVVEVWALDLGSFQSVRDFCQRAETLDRLDVLLESAAVATGEYVEMEGHESSITTNVISTFLMALMLLPLLRRTAVRWNVRPHLVVVSSDAHIFASFREKSAPHIFKALQGRENMTEDRYNISKLLDVLIVRQLAEEMGPESSVIVNTVNPGLCRTQLFRHATFPLNWIIGTGLFLIGRVPEMGSRTLLAAAVAGEESHGKYMDSCVVADESPFVRSEKGRQVQKKVYNELMELLEGIQPGVTKAI